MTRPGESILGVLALLAAGLAIIAPGCWASDGYCPCEGCCSKDVYYVDDGQVGHMVDIYSPPGPGRFPAIVVIYGSAWTQNDKKDITGDRVARVWCPLGYVVAAINHRSSGEANFPAQIHDVKAAIRFLRANADDYRLDPDRIAISGGSSGGHLAALAGVTNGITECTVGDLTISLEGDLGDYRDTSSDVQAVCAVASTTDFLVKTACVPHVSLEFEEALIGGPLEQNLELCALASPITHVDSGDPPFLLIHGTEDPVIHHTQSGMLYQTLQLAGVPSDYHLVEGVGHDPAGLTAEETSRAMIEFFRQTLYGDPEGPPQDPIRFAAFNASLACDDPENPHCEEGHLAKALAEGYDRAKAVAEIIQRVRPDVLLITEFNDDPVAATRFQTDYLEVGQNGLDYPYYFIAVVNSGRPCPAEVECDFDKDGTADEPGDRYGFGHFEGQYGMVIYSMYEVLNTPTDPIRTFRSFLWKDMPERLIVTDPDTGDPWYTQSESDVLPLSSTALWDIPILVDDGQVVHVLASHASAPGFDGSFDGSPEDRNDKRNHDEIRFWADYISQGDDASYIVDDHGNNGGLKPESHFVIMGDLNSDPLDGDSIGNPPFEPTAIWQLLNSPHVNAADIPGSDGAAEQADLQGGANGAHGGDPHHDTGDFDDDWPGNLRVDYVLPSLTMNVVRSGVFWPISCDPLFDLVGTHPFPSSDHRLVWTDLLVADPSIQLTGSASGSPGGVGEVITFCFHAENAGDVPLSNVSIGLDSGEPISFEPLSPPTLEPDEIKMAPLSHIVTQEDLDRGSIARTATVTGHSPAGQEITGSDTVTVSVAVSDIETGIVLTMTADPGSDASVGEDIQFAFTVHNKGDVTLADVSVACPGVTMIGEAIEGLAPHATDSTTFSGSYEVRAADRSAGNVTRTATVQGTWLAGLTISDDASTMVTISSGDSGGAKPDFQDFEIDDDLWGILVEIADDSDEWTWFGGVAISLEDALRRNHLDELLKQFFGQSQVRHALHGDPDGPTFVTRLLGWAILATAGRGSVVTIGGVPLGEVTTWYARDRWPTNQGPAPVCAQGEDICIRFTLLDLPTGAEVRDDTASLCVMRMDETAGTTIVSWDLIPHDPAKDHYETCLETEFLEPGPYDLCVGTSRDCVSRCIGIEIIEP